MKSEEKKTVVSHVAIRPHRELSPKQIAFAKYLAANPHKSKAEICREFGVIPRTMYDWFQWPTFQEKLKEFQESPEVLLTADQVLERLSEPELDILRKKLEKSSAHARSFIPQTWAVHGAVKKLMALDNISPKDWDDLAKRIETILNMIRFKQGKNDFYTIDGECLNPVGALRTEIEAQKDSFELHRQVMRYSDRKLSPKAAAEIEQAVESLDDQLFELDKLEDGLKDMLEDEEGQQEEEGRNGNNGRNGKRQHKGFHDKAAKPITIHDDW